MYWITLLAALVLAACNTDEQEVNKNQGSSQNDTSEVIKGEKQDELSETTVEQKVIFGGDANSEKLVATSTVDYSYDQDRNITEFLIEQLSLSDYYNKHTVSADEKTISLDFKETIVTSQQVQGSAGAYIFSESLAVTFFKNIPNLQTLQVRVNGKEQELSHTAIFTGALTRETVEKKHPELVK